MENDLLTSELKGHRTLATVLFTDCVGFSARMSVDEDHTLDLIRRDLKFMKQVCEHYEGRVLKSTGDGLLMCFISAVKAVECAIEIQRTLNARSASLPPENALEHRIGIHLADMFITETDVMGNGVNIAARLQTEADPGGICISQTVYDVIKAGLHLETRYLGPRELKNIREVVPVYKILLQPDAEPTDPLPIAVRNLERNRNLLRIKKLLFYACHNTWEGDAHRLAALNLTDLLRTLADLAPTPGRLQAFLDTAVKTLSKPTEYSLVASTIVKEMMRLYPETPEQDATVVSRAIVDTLPPPIAPTPYESIAQNLEQTGNSVRVKKLIFYICRRRWENDTASLNAAPLATLLAELHEAAPTLERLRATLDRFVQTLSKQAEYALVANLILAQFQSLYPQPDVPPQPPQAPDAPQVLASIEHVELAVESPPAPAAADPYEAVVNELEQANHLPRIKKLLLFLCRRQWERDPEQIQQLRLDQLVPELHSAAHTATQLDAALTAVVRTLNKQDEYRAIAHTIRHAFRHLYPAEPAAPQSPSPTHPRDHGAPEHPLQPAAAVPNAPPSRSPIDRASQPLNAPFNLFDFRLGIMKYANPLRAKMLLAAALYDDDSSSQDLSNLKARELDSLLRHLLSTCKTYTELEAVLYGAARRFSELDETMQTAEAIIKCLRSFYLHGGGALVTGNSTEATQINLDDFEETTLEFASIADEDDCTCQLLPANPGGEPLAAPSVLPAPTPVMQSDRVSRNVRSEDVHPAEPLLD